VYLHKLPWQLIICSNETDSKHGARKKIGGSNRTLSPNISTFKVLLFLSLLLFFICDVTTMFPEVLGFHTFYTRHEIASVSTLT